MESSATAARFIVVVDDEDVVRDLLTSTLEMAGYQVRGFADGGTALAYLADARVDAIIADCFMPGVDGRAVHDHLARTRPELARRMVFVSGNLSDDRVSNFLARTGAPALQKPFRLAEVTAVLNTILERQGKEEPGG